MDMKSFTIFTFLSTTLLAFAATPTVSVFFRGDDVTGEIIVNSNNLSPWAQQKKPSSSLGGSNSIRNNNGYRPLSVTTCGRNPKVCAANGSAGPKCCSNKCVNLQTDRLNCGKCGAKCGFSQVCCGGVCVNPMASKSHCGSCNNRCGKGGRCSYGMCSYA